MFPTGTGRAQLVSADAPGGIDTQRGAEVAAAACVSERTLARLLAEETSTVGRDYVRRVRLISAMENLTNPSESIAQLAHASGYESLGAFNAAFRTFTGHAPSGYWRCPYGGLSSGNPESP